MADQVSFTLSVKYTPESFIAGRTTAEVMADLASRDGSEIDGDTRRAIIAACEARKARKAAEKAQLTVVTAAA